MRAARYDRFGAAEVLRVVDVPEPTPAPGQVRVRVHAAALNPKDVLLRKGRMALLGGRRFPRGQGYDLAGVIDAVGPGAGAWEVGDPVFGMIQDWAGGACAEAVCIPEGELARKPDALSWVQVASVPLAGLTALQALRDLLAVQPDDRVCINGASGGVGTLAVQIAVTLGAEVTAVCSDANAALVRDLGATSVIDYRAEDPTSRDAAWDAFFDVFGNKPWPRARGCIGARGRFCTTVPRPRAVLREVAGRLRMHRARLVIVKSNRADLETLAGWLADGRLRPVLDQVLPFDQIVAANERVETRRARGKVVLTIA